MTPKGRQKYFLKFIKISFILTTAPALPSLRQFHFIFADNDLYIGTDADFSGNDPIIYREPLQTDQYDSLSLNGEIYGGNAVADNRHNPPSSFQHPISSDRLRSGTLCTFSSAKQLLSLSTAAKYVHR